MYAKCAWLHLPWTHDWTTLGYHEPCELPQTFPSRSVPWTPSAWRMQAWRLHTCMLRIIYMCTKIPLVLCYADPNDCEKLCIFTLAQVHPHNMTTVQNRVCLEPFSGSLIYLCPVDIALVCLICIVFVLHMYSVYITIFQQISSCHIRAARERDL